MNLIKKQLDTDFKKLEQIVKDATEKYTSANFVNVDGKYFTTDFKEPSFVKYIHQLITTKHKQFDIYIEEKYITLLPKVCNKKSVVTYLIKKHKPKFSIGIGNSESDIDFLNECDFKIVSHIGSLNDKLLK